MIAPDVGGGFGAKIGLYAEDLLLPWLARAAGRTGALDREPLGERWSSLGHGRAQIQDVTIGGSRDGQGYGTTDLEVVQDAGAYPSLGAILPVFTRVMMASGTYDFAKVEYSAPPSVVTNDHADGRLPRCGAPGGDRRGRAGDGSLRRRARHGPGRGPPA